MWWGGVCEYYKSEEVLDEFDIAGLGSEDERPFVVGVHVLPAQHTTLVGLEQSIFAAGGE